MPQSQQQGDGGNNSQTQQQQGQQNQNQSQGQTQQQQGQGQQQNTQSQGQTITLSKDQYDALQARIDALEGKGQTQQQQGQGQQQNQNQQQGDGSLLDGVRQQQQGQQKNQAQTSALEAALKFNINAPNWLKENESLLPKEVSEIFKAAEGEKYDNAIEKDQDIKASIIQSFFSVQSNLDLLTPAIKIQLEDFLKLTKNGKREKAQGIFDNIFEPSFDMLKRIKKAEALQKGHGDGSDESYKSRLMQGSRKHYLGETNNA